MNFQTGNKFPGIVGLFAYSPESGKVLNRLAQTVLWDPNFSTLLPAERELLAAHTSRINQCEFCYRSHRAFAEAYLGKEAVSLIIDDGNFEANDKLRGLFGLVYLVTRTPNALCPADVEALKNTTPVTDKEIHDTILIASMFNMYNRYVSGCGVAKQELTDEYYDNVAKRLAAGGYASIQHDLPMLIPTAETV